MHYSAVLILFASSICALNSSEKRNAGEQEPTLYESTFLTRIDHSKPTNQNLTKFVYHANAQYLRDGGGPVYIYLKDINEQGTKSIETGLMVDIARSTGALLLTFDMRFFGKNRPTSDVSLESLALLTVDQTLADIAMFIRYIREITTKSDCTVILWGSGYGATLAAWARQRYPHLVAGSWASSGQFFMTAFTYVPIENLRLVIEDVNTTSSDYVCRDNMRRVYRKLNSLIEYGDGHYIADKFKLCHPVDTDSEEDVAAFYELIVTTIFDYIQHYGFDGVKSFCSSMENVEPRNLLAAFADWFQATHVKLLSPLNIVILKDDHTYCFDHTFDGLVRRSSYIEWNSYSTYGERRQWLYLKCTQLGGFPIANKLTWLPQSITRDYHMKKCNQIFGTPIESKTLDMAVKNLNEEFSERDPNILYSTGEIDPWKLFTYAFDSYGYGIAVKIDDAVKSADLASISAGDSSSLYHAKKTASRLVKQWSTTPKENFAEIVTRRLHLDKTFMYRELWWENFGERDAEWNDDYWPKVFELMDLVAKEKKRMEETNNGHKTQADIWDEKAINDAIEDLFDEEMDKTSEEVDYNEMLQQRVRKTLLTLEDSVEHDPNSNEEDSILHEVTIMVKLALKLALQNYDICDDEECTENTTEESDDFDEWYSTKIFENWNQPLDFLKIDDNFRKNHKLAKEWLDNDLFQLDFENELKRVDRSEFHSMYISLKLALEYDKYREEQGNIFGKPKKI